MKSSPGGMPRFATILAVSALLAACATQGEKIPQKSTSSATSTSASTPPPATSTPLPNNLPAVSRTTVEVQCKTPAESYDFSAVIASRFGAEGQARLQTLMSSNFSSASLTPKDKEMLKVLSTEMLWIPVPVEEQIGNALLLASSRDLTALEKTGPNATIWAKSVEMVSDLQAVAPPNPFTLRLILLEKGEPGSLAGGVIYMDNQTITSVFDNLTPQSEEKLRFVLAHELAHIYKRHRAKRIQLVLVDTDAGLKLMRLLFNQGRAKTGAASLAAVQEWGQTIVALPEIVQALQKKHDAYAMNQELEADACATSMMMSAKLGDPLRAFKAYAKDASQIRASNVAVASQGSDAAAAGANNMINTHPPDSTREANIATKMREYGGAGPSPSASTPSSAPQMPTAGGRKARSSTATSSKQ